MAGRRQLDPPGDAEAQQVILLLLLALSAHLAAQPQVGQNAHPSDIERLAAVQKLYEGKKWEEVACLAQGPPDQPAELDYLAGMSLAHLQHWQEAREYFTSGHRKAPRDARFLVERAGVSYRLNDIPSAKADLRAALRLNPKDPYSREFLGTLFFLDGNLEAALKYWNAIEKPQLASVHFDPPPHLNDKLRERAVTFAAPAVLNLDALRTTEARLENLGVFVRENVEMKPLTEEGYNAAIRTTEHAGWRDGPLVGTVSLFRGVFYETVYPEFYNLAGTARNVTSLLRWDDQKRRAGGTFSTPVGGNPGLRFRFFLDARNENWNLSRTFFGTTTPLEDLNLRTLAGGVAIRMVVNGRWSWSNGVEAIARRFRNLSSGISPAALPFFTNGTTVEAWARVEHALLRMPERRFSLDSTDEVKAGRGLSDALGGFAILSGSLRAHWLPRAREDDYEVLGQLRAADTFGHVTLDQLFQLGVERDNDLWLRGHSGTTDGRKGRAPLGRRYVLLNSEIDKHVYDGGLIALKLGPFVDTGAIADATGLFGSQRWLWDIGVQGKVRIFGRLSVLLSYGRDLRTAQNVFYATASR